MTTQIEALLTEQRRFPPSDAFRDGADIKDRRIYEEAQQNGEAFWQKQAESLEWMKPYQSVLSWTCPDARWFEGGQLNASVNCIDRHLRTWRRNKAAIVWEGETGQERVLTYNDLHREVCKCANMLRSLGVQKGDRVTVYMGMVPELVITLLACARIGAPHSVVFGGFSAESLRDRILDGESKIVITADGAYRRGTVVRLKAAVDEALLSCPDVKNVVVLKHLGDSAAADFVEGRDHWWHRLMAHASMVCEPEPMESEDMLFMLYTSGTTGSPKGIVHTTAGYLLGTSVTHKWIFDLKDEDVYWCTADIGWITGHSYVVYGPLANGATVLMYEGAPDWPDKNRFWSIVEKYRVTILYTAPTAIRAFMKWGTQYPKSHDLKSLRLLGSVGEPINPEAWMWYHEHIGGGRCPIVDTWWQTETGMIMISSLPGITDTKPGSATFPVPGVQARVVDDQGKSVKAGYLVLTQPWPAMLRTIWKNHERYQEGYWSRYEGLYFTGDGCKVDDEGYYWLLGRVDDVMNVAGHRISTMEVESALVDHPDVAEAAVIGRAHEVKGQGITAFVTLKTGATGGPDKLNELREHVAKKIGAIAKPDEIHFTADLPKTRSGKIMRRLLRDIAEGRVLGDTTTLADPAVINSLRSTHEDKE